MERYANVEDERAAKLLDSYKQHKQLSDEEAKLLKVLRTHGTLLLPYINNNFKRLVSHVCNPLNVDLMLAYKVSPAKSNSKHPDVINVTDMATQEGYSVHHIATMLRDQGYKVKYDRNRVYCLDRVITFVEVK